MFDVSTNGVNELEAADPTNDLDTQDDCYDPDESYEESVQSDELNSQFADNRRKQELDEVRHRLEVESNQRQILEQQAQAAKDALELFFDGDDIDALSLQAKAHAYGQTPQEFIYQSQQLALEHEEKDRRMSELEEFRREATFAHDLSEIRAVDPQITSVMDLGEDFLRLRANGISNLAAYHAIRSSLDSSDTQSMGDISDLSPQAHQNRYTSMSDEDFEKEVKRAARGELKRK